MEITSGKRLAGLPFVADKDSAILVLGTFPGPESLRLRRYYADPRNKFWEIMGLVLGSNAASYADRTFLLRDHGIALWDVVKSCERLSAQDKDIQNPRANNLLEFVRSHPKLRTIVFNGGEAEKLARRLLPNLMNQPGVKYETLISTSGSTVGYSVNDKVDRWSKLRTYATPASDHRPR